MIMGWSLLFWAMWLLNFETLHFCSSFDFLIQGRHFIDNLQVSKFIILWSILVGKIRDFPLQITFDFINLFYVL